MTHRLDGWGPRLAVAIVLIAVVYPLLRFLLTPWFPSFAPAQPATGSAIDGALLAYAAGNSLRVGIETGLAALVPGFAIAFLLERRTWRGSRWLAGGMWLVFLTPSYLLTTGWQILMAQPSLQSGSVAALFYSEAGIVGLLAIKGLPFVSLTARAGWSLIGGEIGDAAQLHVRSPWRRFGLVLRLLSPVAMAAFVIVFVEAIGDFGVAATLGAHIHLPLITYDIYARLARTPINFSAAAILSLMLLAMAGLALTVHYLVGRRTPALLSGRSRPAPRPGLSRAETAGTAALLIVVAMVATVVPALALFGQASEGDAAAGVTAAEMASLGYSASYATIASLLALVLATTLLHLNAGGAFSVRIMNALTIGAMAIPGLVLGAAYVIAFNGWLPLYGSPWLLVAAYVVGHLPVLMRLLEAPLRSTHASLSDAACLHGLGWRTRLVRIHLPILLRPMTWAWSVAFGSIFFELPLSSLLHPAGRAPLGVQLLTFDEGLHFAAEARLALAGAAICLGVVVLVTDVLPRWLIAPGRYSRTSITGAA